MLSTVSKRDTLLEISIDERATHWLYNNIPFLEFYSQDSVILTDALKYANAFNNAFKNERIRDYPKAFAKNYCSSSTRLSAYASFVRLATRFGVPVKFNIFICFHKSTDKGVRLVMKPGGALADVCITDLEGLIDYIWVEQGKQFYPEANLDADEAAMVSFMALRYIASTNGKFVQDVGNQGPSYTSYPATSLDTSKLRDFLRKVNSVGGFTRLILLSPVEYAYPDRLVELMVLMKAGVTAEVVEEIVKDDKAFVGSGVNAENVKIFESVVSKI